MDATDKFRNIIEKYKTPLFVYDRDIILSKIEDMKQTIGENFEIVYSMKANPNPVLLQLFHSSNLLFEVASSGELSLLLNCGIAPEKILFAGPGKTADELKFCVDKKILSINVESMREIATLETICSEQNTNVDICLRININLDSIANRRELNWFSTSKFGIDEHCLDEIVVFLRSHKRVRCIGLHVHMASNVTNHEILTEYLFAICHQIINIMDKFKITLKIVNFGGGWGNPNYLGERELDSYNLRQTYKKIAYLLKNSKINGRMLVESGRYLIGSAGYYIADIVDIKERANKNIIVINGGINHMLFLSSAFRIRGKQIPIGYIRKNKKCSKREVSAKKIYEIGGSLCTPIDYMANHAELPSDLKPGDYLVFTNAGAYTKMASPLNFLGHDWPSEVLLSHGEGHLIASPISLNDIISLQNRLQQD